MAARARLGQAHLQLVSGSFTTRFRPPLRRAPRVHPSAFIAPGATVVGDVTLGEESSVWFSAVVRGDINSIVIGARSNIQDGAVVHLDSIYGTQIGNYVTVGHRAIVHACAIEDEVLVGMGAIVLDGAKVGAQSLIGADPIVVLPQVAEDFAPQAAIKRMSIQENETPTRLLAPQFRRDREAIICESPDPAGAVLRQ